MEQIIRLADEVGAVRRSLSFLIASLPPGIVPGLRETLKSAEKELVEIEGKLQAVAFLSDTSGGKGRLIQLLDALLILIQANPSDIFELRKLAETFKDVDKHLPEDTEAGK